MPRRELKTVLTTAAKRTSEVRSTKVRVAVTRNLGNVSRVIPAKQENNNQKAVLLVLVIAVRITIALDKYQKAITLL